MQPAESLDINVLAQPNLHKSLRNTKWKKKRQQTGKNTTLMSAENISPMPMKAMPIFLATDITHPQHKK